jgi:hypothetical protein
LAGSGLTFVIVKLNETGDIETTADDEVITIFED